MGYFRTYVKRKSNSTTQFLEEKKLQSYILLSGFYIDTPLDVYNKKGLKFKVVAFYFLFIKERKAISNKTSGK